MKRAEQTSLFIVEVNGKRWLVETFRSDLCAEYKRRRIGLWREVDDIEDIMTAENYPPKRLQEVLAD